jgi:hypothetical protein
MWRVAKISFHLLKSVPCANSESPKEIASASKYLSSISIMIALSLRALFTSIVSI